MNRSSQIRGMFILCGHFARNAAYYRAGWVDGVLVPDDPFWRTINGNFLDIAVLEWCKLFADSKGKHHWRNALRQPSEFEDGLFHFSALTPDDLNQYILVMRTYRDKFVAHLDEERKAHIPHLGLGEKCVELLHTYLRQKEQEGLALSPKPRSYRWETKRVREQAVAAYESIRATNYRAQADFNAPHQVL